MRIAYFALIKEMVIKVSFWVACFISRRNKITQLASVKRQPAHILLLPKGIGSQTMRMRNSKKANLSLPRKGLIKKDNAVFSVYIRDLLL
jgi:hypothetical protein